MLFRIGDKKYKNEYYLEVLFIWAKDGSLANLAIKSARAWEEVPKPLVLSVWRKKTFSLFLFLRRTKKKNRGYRHLKVLNLAPFEWYALTCQLLSIYFLDSLDICRLKSWMKKLIFTQRPAISKPFILSIAFRASGAFVNLFNKKRKMDRLVF